MTQQTGGRRVIANMNFSLDGCYARKDAPEDMGWVMPFAVTDVARDHMSGLWETATTALLGRVNAEGFMGFWPTVIGMEGADPRDEGFAKWLVGAEKVVLSSTRGGSVGADEGRRRAGRGRRRGAEGGRGRRYSRAFQCERDQGAAGGGHGRPAVDDDFPGLSRRRAASVRGRAARGAVDARRAGRR